MLLDALPTLPVVGTGCSTVILRAISSGDAKVSVSFAQHEATIVLSAYPALKVFPLYFGSFHINLTDL